MPVLTDVHDIEEIKPVATIVEDDPDWPDEWVGFNDFDWCKIRSLPAGTELYALPATHRIVPVELLERCTERIVCETLSDELRAIIDKEPT